MRYAALRKTGSRRSGNESDKGSQFHAVPYNSNRAFCGTEPGDRSDWSVYPGNDVTCPRCLAKLAKAAA
jgi:hypothetical protein